MTALGLFAVPLPSHPTVTQVEAAARLAPHLARIEAAIYAVVQRFGAEGRTAREAANWTGWTADRLVTVRARLTGLHQRGLLIRTTIRRDGQLVYVHPDFWKPEYGCTPSRRHGAR